MTLKGQLEERLARAFVFVIYIGIICLVVLLLVNFSHARDDGQWDVQELETRQWYKALMMPDMPTLPCCGESDAYWCDDYYARGGKAYCRITDDRADEPRRRPHVALGTEFEIPDHKLKYDQSNPTGHGVIFLSAGGSVYCFVAPGGV